jgi:orotate phosphoribosyltransferase
MRDGQPAPENVIKVLTDAGAWRANGHFVLASGMHSNFYLDKSRASVHMETRETLAYMLGSHLRLLDLEVIVASPMGAIPFGVTVANDMFLSFAFLEKGPDDLGGLVLRGANAEAVRGKKVGLVEDVVTSGNTLIDAVQCLRDSGAEVAAVVCIANRNGFELGEPGLKSLLCMDDFKAADIRMWRADGCQLCAQGVPVSTDCGHGRQFLEFCEEVARDAADEAARELEDEEAALEVALEAATSDEEDEDAYFAQVDKEEKD